MALFDLTAEEIGIVQRKRVTENVEMSNGKCIDYPCCNHTDGLGCDWVSPNENPALYFCMNHGDEDDAYPWHPVGKACYYDEEGDDDE